MHTTRTDGTAYHVHSPSSHPIQSHYYFYSIFLFNIISLHDFISLFVQLTTCYYLSLLDKSQKQGEPLRAPSLIPHL